jgi:DNA mismatch endonuclease (patch repair protein)
MAPNANHQRGWVSTPKSGHLRGRRARDTSPELLLRRELYAQGARYRLHRRVIGRLSADIVLPRSQVAVFVDGCFWHGCPKHGRETFAGPNASLWEEKLQRNRQRDQRANQGAESAGWHILRLWECEIKANPQAAACRVLELASATARSSDNL